jgi:hypothetical protein
VLTGFWGVNLRERDHWGYPDVDERIILSWMEGRVVFSFLLGKPEGNTNWGGPDVDRRIIFRRMEVTDLHRFLVGKPEGKSKLGLHRCRWDDNIKMDRGQRWAQGSGGET